MGVGSLKPSKAERSSEGTSSWSKERTGSTDGQPSGMWRVISFFLRKASTSEEEGAEREDEGVAEEEAAGVSGSATLLFLSFLCFFSFLSLGGSWSSSTASSACAAASSLASFLRFFLSFFEEPSGTLSPSSSRLRFFFDFFSEEDSSVMSFR